MNKSNWTLDDDGTQINSVSDIHVPWLGVSLETWFEIEENQTWHPNHRNLEKLLSALRFKPIVDGWHYSNLPFLLPSQINYLTIVTHHLYLKY